jgi:glycerophosphoryl diester phosphodiesterase
MQAFFRVLKAYRAALAGGGAFLPLYLLLQLIAAGISAPLIGAAVTAALKLSDQPALTDQDIAFFLLSPLGALSGVVSVCLFAAAEVFTFAAMAAAVASGNAGGLRGAMSAVVRVGARLRSLILYVAHFLLRIAVWVLPAAVLGLIGARLLLMEYDINYYLTARPPEFLLALALGGVLGGSLAAVLLLRLSAWAVSLHLVLFEGSAPAAAFKESAARMSGQRSGLKLELLIWVLVRLSIGAALAFAAGLAVGLIPAGGEVPVTQVLLFGLLAVLLLVSGNLVLSAVSLGALALLLQRFWGGRIGEAREASRAPLAGMAVGAAAIAAAGLWGGAALWGDLQVRDDVEIIAHRGAAGSAPENTLAAVEEALAQGTDWVEIDVQETADGQIAVVHDADLMKLAGVPLQIHAEEFAALAAEDIGSWFDPVFADQRVPLLRDVLEIVRGRASLLIEFKHYGHADKLEERVIAEVEAAGMADQVALMSLKYPSVQKAITLRPDWRSGVLAASAVGDLARLDGDFLAVRAAMAQPGLLRRLHAADKEIYVWTVNDPLEMSKMISKGVDGIITDEPGMARQVLEARAGLSQPERMVLWLIEELGLDPDKDRYRDESP